MLNLIPPESILGSSMFLILGFGLLIKGGDFFINGSVGMALKFKIPLSFIGLTLVALGTSAPELFTTTYAGLTENYDLAITNVLGSNIFNTCIILGLAGLLFPFSINKKNFYWDISWLTWSTILLILFSWDLQIKFYEAISLVLLYFIFIISSWLFMKNTTNDLEPTLIEKKSVTNFKNLIFISLGILGLLLGSRLAIKGGLQLGALLGFPDRYIGLIFLALGTSLPEMVASLTAAYKGHNDIVVSNVTGSNITNILFALGFSSTVSTFKISEKVLNPDIFVCLSVLLLFGLLVFIGKFKFSKIHGLILLLSYFSYLSLFVF